jgi:heat shock protein HslJ
MRSVRTLAVLALAGSVLAACGGLRNGAGGGGLDPDALDGRTFLSTSVLEDGVDRPLVPGSRIQLGFADGRISIHAGCNSMGGGYEIDGDTLRLKGGLATTEMGCDPERHEQDAWVSAFLGGGPRIRLEGDRLTLTGAGVAIELLDREVADPDRPLVGTPWRLESIVQGETVSSVPAGLAASLGFLEGGSVRVDTGCNEGGGPVTVGEGTLTFGSLTMTERSCGPDADAFERQILDVLRGEVAYAIEGPLLSIRAGALGLDWRA